MVVSTGWLSAMVTCLDCLVTSIVTPVQPSAIPWTSFLTYNIFFFFLHNRSKIRYKHHDTKRICIEKKEVTCVTAFSFPKKQESFRTICHWMINTQKCSRTVLIQMCILSVVKSGTGLLFPQIILSELGLDHKMV